MAKYKRTTIGSVVKGQDGKPDYIKVSSDVVLKKGDYLNLESKAQQLKGIEGAVSSGKMSEEGAEKAIERINKIPDFVRFEIVRIEKN